MSLAANTQKSCLADLPRTGEKKRLVANLIEIVQKGV